MSKRHNARSASDKSRILELSGQIESLYGHLAPDEIEIQAAQFERSTTLMIEILRVGTRSSHAMDLCEDIHYKPVVLPKELRALLKRYDVFLATLGLRAGRWNILYMSPPYLSEIH